MNLLTEDEQMQAIAGYLKRQELYAAPSECQKIVDMLTAEQFRIQSIVGQATGDQVSLHGKAAQTIIALCLKFYGDGVVQLRASSPEMKRHSFRVIEPSTRSVGDPAR